MPKIKIDHVISFSSEDPAHIANNILSNDPAKKWKCNSPGEKSAIIVLQLEKASLISSIDVGNENSAYIEILATRSSNTNDDYKVLLVMSSFMTPLEARQNTNVNKVRMFTYDQLSKPECDQKWDRIKIVCTQPFNRHVQYGLSFLTLHSPEDKNIASNIQTTIGKFIFRPDSPTDNLSAGSLFERRKELKKEEPLKGAAAIREASSSASLSLYGSPVCKPKLKGSNATPKNNNKTTSIEDKPLPRNRHELLYSKDEEEANEKIDKLVEQKLNEANEKRAKEKQAKEEELLKMKIKRNKKNDDDDDDDEEARSEKKKKKDDSLFKFEGKKKGSDNKLNSPKQINELGESSKRKKNDEEKEKPNKKPKKDDKQTTIIYKPFEQLLNGIIFVISGIQNPDRANLRTMALAMGAKYSADWNNNCTHLICAFQNTPKFNQVKGKGKIITKKWVEDCYLQRKRFPWRRYALDKTDKSLDESEDEVWEKEMGSETTEIISDDDDDDETTNDTLIEEDIILNNKNESDSEPIKKLPDFFTNKRFFLDQNFDKQMTKLLNKYIVAYNGVIIEDPSDNRIDFFITEDKAANNNLNTDAVYLKPDWVWECHNYQKIIPTDNYVL